MKEKIKELMQQAGTDVSGKWMSVDNAEKFAELIVQECCDILKDTFDCHFEAEQLKEHFGVE